MQFFSNWIIRKNNKNGITRKRGSVKGEKALCVKVGTRFSKFPRTVSLGWEVYVTFGLCGFTKDSGTDNKKSLRQSGVGFTFQRMSL